ncbi:hypothetical protein DFJ73DRAFT_332715 [Zopfochytrium polystomum]|nr:hypothetical protein DFJ73DRAFT_332715 [Zopfochytrium polystomum]
MSGIGGGGGGGNTERPPPWMMANNGAPPPPMSGQPLGRMPPPPNFTNTNHNFYSDPTGNGPAGLPPPQGFPDQRGWIDPQRNGPPPPGGAAGAPGSGPPRRVFPNGAPVPVPGSGSNPMAPNYPSQPRRSTDRPPQNFAVNSAPPMPAPLGQLQNQAPPQFQQDPRQQDPRFVPYHPSSHTHPHQHQDQPLPFGSPPGPMGGLPFGSPQGPTGGLPFGSPQGPTGGPPQFGPREPSSSGRSGGPPSRGPADGFKQGGPGPLPFGQNFGPPPPQPPPQPNHPPRGPASNPPQLHREPSTGGPPIRRNNSAHEKRPPPQGIPFDDRDHPPGPPRVDPSREGPHGFHSQHQQQPPQFPPRQHPPQGPHPHGARHTTMQPPGPNAEMDRDRAEQSLRRQPTREEQVQINYAREQREEQRRATLERQRHQQHEPHRSLQNSGPDPGPQLARKNSNEMHHQQHQQHRSRANSNEMNHLRGKESSFDMPPQQHQPSMPTRPSNELDRQLQPPRQPHRGVSPGRDLAQGPPPQQRPRRGSSPNRDPSQPPKPQRGNSPGRELAQQQQRLQRGVSPGREMAQQQQRQQRGNSPGRESSQQQRPLRGKSPGRELQNEHPHHGGHPHGQRPITGAPHPGVLPGRPGQTLGGPMRPGQVSRDHFSPVPDDGEVDRARPPNGPRVAQPFQPPQKHAAPHRSSFKKVGPPRESRPPPRNQSPGRDARSIVAQRNRPPQPGMPHAGSPQGAPSGTAPTSATSALQADSRPPPNVQQRNQIPPSGRSPPQQPSKPAILPIPKRAKAADLNAVTDDDSDEEFLDEKIYIDKAAPPAALAGVPSSSKRMSFVGKRQSLVKTSAGAQKRASMVRQRSAARQSILSNRASFLSFNSVMTGSSGISTPAYAVTATSRASKVYDNVAFRRTSIVAGAAPNGEKARSAGARAQSRLSRMYVVKDEEAESDAEEVVVDDEGEWWNDDDVESPPSKRGQPKPNPGRPDGSPKVAPMEGPPHKSPRPGPQNLRPPSLSSRQGGVSDTLPNHQRKLSNGSSPSRSNTVGSSPTTPTQRGKAANKLGALMQLMDGDPDEAAIDTDRPRRSPSLADRAADSPGAARHRSGSVSKTSQGSPRYSDRDSTGAEIESGRRDSRARSFTNTNSPREDPDGNHQKDHRTQGRSPIERPRNSDGLGLAVQRPPSAGASGTSRSPAQQLAQLRRSTEALATKLPPTESGSMELPPIAVGSALTDEFEFDYFDSYGRESLVSAASHRAQASTPNLNGRGATAASSPVPSSLKHAAIANLQRFSTKPSSDRPTSTDFRNLQSEIATLRAALSTAESNIEPLRQALKERDDSLAAAKSALVAAEAAAANAAEASNSNEKTAALQRRIAEVEAAVEHAEAEREAVLAQLTEMEASKADLSAAVESHLRERDAVEEEVEAALDERDAALADAAEKGRALEEARAAVSAATNELDEVKRREREARARAGDAEGRMREAVAALEGAQRRAELAEAAVEGRDGEGSRIELEEKWRAEVNRVKGELEAALREAERNAKDLEATEDTCRQLNRRIKTITDELEDARSDIERSQRKISRLEGLLADESANGKNLSEQIDGMRKLHLEESTRQQGAFDSLQRAVASANEERLRLESRVLALETTSRQLETERDNWRVRCSDLQRQLDAHSAESVAKLTALERSLADSTGDADAQLKRLGAQLASANTAIAQYRQQIEELELALDSSRGDADRRAELAERLKTAEKERQRAATDVEEVQWRLKAVEDERNRLREEAVVLERRMDDLRAKLKESERRGAESVEAARDEAESTLRKAREEAARVQSELQEELERARKESDRRLDRAWEEVDALRLELDNLRGNMSTDKSLDEGLSNELARMRAELQAVKSEAEKAQESEAAARKLVKEAERRLRDAEDARDELLREVSDVRKKLATEAEDYSRELETARNQIEELRRQLNESLESSRNQGRQIFQLEDRIQEMKSSGASSQQSDRSIPSDELAEARRQISLLRRKLDDAVDREDELNRRMKALEAAPSNRISLAEKSQSDPSELVAFLRTEIDAIQDDLDAKTQDCNHLQRELDAAQRTLQELRRDMASSDPISSEVERLRRALEASETRVSQLEAAYEDERRAADESAKQHRRERDNLGYQIEDLERELEHARHEAARFEEDRRALEDEAYEKARQFEASLAQARKAAMEAADAAKTAASFAAEAAVGDGSEIERELRDRIAQMEEETRTSTASLIQQLQEQQEDAKEVRETLVARLRSQESEVVEFKAEMEALRKEKEALESKLRDLQGYNQTGQDSIARRPISGEHSLGTDGAVPAQSDPPVGPVSEGSAAPSISPPVSTPATPTAPQRKESQGFLSSLWSSGSSAKKQTSPGSSQLATPSSPMPTPAPMPMQNPALVQSPPSSAILLQSPPPFPSPAQPILPPPAAPAGSSQPFMPPPRLNNPVQPWQMPPPQLPPPGFPAMEMPQHGGFMAPPPPPGQFAYGVDPGTPLPNVQMQFVPVQGGPMPVSGMEPAPQLPPGQVPLAAPPAAPAAVPAAEISQPPKKRGWFS